MKINVKTVNGRYTLCLSINAGSTVLQLKEKIHSYVVLEKGESFPVFLLCLEFNSVILDDVQTLKSCGVTKGSTLILRSRYNLNKPDEDEEEEEEEKISQKQKQELEKQRLKEEQRQQQQLKKQMQKLKKKKRPVQEHSPSKVAQAKAATAETNQVITSPEVTPIPEAPLDALTSIQANDSPLSTNSETGPTTSLKPSKSDPNLDEALLLKLKKDDSLQFKRKSPRKSFFSHRKYTLTEEEPIGSFYHLSHEIEKLPFVDEVELVNSHFSELSQY